MTKAIFASLVAAMACVVLFSTPFDHARAASLEPAAITKERLNEEIIADLVAGSMAAVIAGDLSDGLRIYEARLAALPPRSIDRADLTMAFGVAVYAEGRERADVELQTRGIGLLENSVDAYRAAFGDRHPEVAVALNSFADAARYLEPRDPPASVDRSLREAHEIRVAALGADHPETLSTLVAIAEVDGLPSRTRGNKQRIDAVVASLQRISRTETRQSAGHAASVAIAAAFALPVIELANNRDAAARRHTRMAIERARTLQGPDDQVCSTAIAGAAMLADALLAKDYQAESKELMDGFVLPDSKNSCSPVGPDVI